MSDAMLWNEIGNIHLKLGSAKDAIACYTKAMELSPDSGWVYCSLGQAYLQTEEFGQALYMFRKSLQLLDSSENKATVWNKIGDAYRALKDIDNAIEAYRKADALGMGGTVAEQNPSRQIEQVANEADREEKNNQAANGLPPEYDDQPVVNDKNGETINSASESNLSNEESELEENVSPDDGTATKPIYLPKSNLKEDPIAIPPQVDKSQNGIPSETNLEKSSPLKEKVLIVIPEPSPMVEKTGAGGPSNHNPEQKGSPVPSNGNGKDPHGKLKSYPKPGPGSDDLEEILAKVNIYENITRVNPTSDRGWDTLGKLYKTLGRYTDAIGAYQKAIEAAPDKEVYFYYLGLLFSVEQQHENAIQAFQFVLRKNPDYVLAHSALAGVYHRMGLENKANHHIAIALPRMNNESTYNRACFYVICGDQELAFEFLRLALKNKETTIDWIKSDPDLDPLRNDKRYQELLLEQEQPSQEISKENYFSSELEGKRNKILPILNHSLTR